MLSLPNLKEVRMDVEGLDTMELAQNFVWVFLYHLLACYMLHDTCYMYPSVAAVLKPNKVKKC